MVSSPAAITITALFISLVSLLAGLLRLITQFLAAEGYSRCREPILGPWARLTRCPWHWTEFRYETIYTAPEIKLVSIAEHLGEEKAPHSHYSLLAPLGPCRKFRVLNIKSRAQYTGQSRVDEPPPAARRWFHPLIKVRNRRVRKCYSDYLNKTLNETFEPKPHRIRRPASKTHSDPATWIFFIKELAKCFDHSDVSANKEERNEVQLVMREKSWDTTPDFIRPPASTNLNVVIILALRLGMEWTSLKDKKSGFEAHGNGYRLISGTPHGDICLEFEAVRKACPDDRCNMMATVPVNKLMFGILPGCPQLRVPELRLVTDNGTLDMVNTLSDFIEMSAEAQQLLQMPSKGGGSSLSNVIFNDLIVLLCPYLPLKGSPADEYRFGAWKGRTPHRSTFHSEELKHTLEQQLELRCQEVAKTDSAAAERMKYILETMKFLREEEHHREHLVREYRQSFDSALSMSSAREKVKSPEQIFHYTTQYFQMYATTHGLRYADIVAAYLEMGAKAARESATRQFSLRKRPSEASFMMQLGSCFCEEETRHVFRECIKDVLDEEHASRLGDEEVEAV